jgi:hypothetical protein
MKKVTISTIDGPFRGWKSGRTYKLSNGEAWKQVEYKYKYIYDIIPTPRAIIWKDRAKYFLEVESMIDRVEVRKEKIVNIEDDE